MTVDILCRVVDNFGDIGVVWRLAKALKSYAPTLQLRIVIDNFAAFAAINPEIDPGAVVQSTSVAEIVSWESPSPLLTQTPAKVCIEAFACGRPDWYDALFYDPSNPTKRLHISLEYLSAEPYAAEFHLLPSLSPIPQVKKLFFMPGFSPGTGGLILDSDFICAKQQWMESRHSGTLARRREAAWRTWVPLLAAPPGDATWISVFSYEHDYKPLVRDLTAWSESGVSPVVLVAAGKSAAGFFQAWETARSPFPAIALPFLPQEIWDQVLLSCDFNIVRGEESLARACLSGIPFLWQAYLQDEGHQQVKAEALVTRMASHFSDVSAWQAWTLLMASFNQRTVNSAEVAVQEDYLTVLHQLEELGKGCISFAESLEKLGDCAKSLLSLFDQIG